MHFAFSYKQFGTKNTFSVFIFIWSTLTVDGRRWRHSSFLGRRWPSCSFPSGRRLPLLFFYWLMSTILLFSTWSTVDARRQPFYSPFHHALIFPQPNQYKNSISYFRSFYLNSLIRHQHIMIVQWSLKWFNYYILQLSTWKKRCKLQFVIFCKLQLRLRGVDQRPVKIMEGVYNYM